jgi:hypothetical protein
MNFRFRSDRDQADAIFDACDDYYPALLLGINRLPPRVDNEPNSCSPTAHGGQLAEHGEKRAFQNSQRLVAQRRPLPALQRCLTSLSSWRRRSAYS